MRKGFIAKLMLMVALITAPIFSSCNERPEGILSESEMVDLLTDIQLAEAYASTSGPGGERIDKNSLVESVLKKHGVTHKQLDETLKYYGRNLDDYYKLHDKVEKKLRALNGTIKSEQANAADDIWPYSKFAAFMPNQLSDGITFSMPADDFEKGNMLEWSMRVTSGSGIDLTLGVEYEDGTSSLIRRSGSGRSLQINLQTDTALTVKRIFGTMTVPQSNLPLWTDSIRLTKVEFDSLNYSKINQQRHIKKPLSKGSYKAAEKKDTMKADVPALSPRPVAPDTSFRQTR